MIERKNYRASLLTKDGRVSEEMIQQAPGKDKGMVREAIMSGKCLTVALYQHEDM